MYTHQPMQLSPIFQKLAQTNLYLIIILYLFLISYFLYTDVNFLKWTQILALLFVGLTIWTIAEYFIHRFLFHGKSNVKFINYFRYFMHGYHHEKPRDGKRLVVPLIFSLPVTLFNFLLIKVSFGHGESIVAGFTLGYIIYDITHYRIHCTQPKTSFGKFLRRYHFYHHFKDNRKCFGVTSPFWDLPLKTRVKVR